MNNKYDGLTKEYLEDLIWNKNQSLTSISKKVFEERGIKPSTFEWYCRNKIKIKTRSVEDTNKLLFRRLTDEQEQRLCDRYSKDNISITQLKDEFNLSLMGVQKILKRRNIPRKKARPYKIWNKGLDKSDIRIAKISKVHSIAMKKKFEEDENFRLSAMRGLEIAREKKFTIDKTRINKKEQLLLNLLNRLFPNEYKFVGDFSVVFDRFSPDFININGQKKIIELYGTFWHNFSKSKARDNKRISIYKKYGYDTLVVKEEELKDIEQLETKLIAFNSN